MAPQRDPQKAGLIVQKTIQWLERVRLDGAAQRRVVNFMGPRRWLVQLRPWPRRILSILVFTALFWMLQGGFRSTAGLPSALAASDPVIAAAGDIACDPADSHFNNGLGTTSNCHQKYTSDLLFNSGLSAILDLGDNQYFCGGYQAFLQSYDPTWGRLKSITHPALGNHEYLTSGGTDCNINNEGAAGYFSYFGSAAGTPGQGYYSFDVGAWHIIALNSNCSDAGGCGSTSAQYKWLQSDLASHTNLCTLAYWHIPYFSSGGRAAANTRAFWQLLYSYNADLILNGHDHIYERFAPQDPVGAADPARGMREFVVGTGGANHTTIASVAANSEVRNIDSFGVLKLTLHPTGYDWHFVHESGESFSDSGSGSCHGPDTIAPSAPTHLVVDGVNHDHVDLSWTASTDNLVVVGYRVFRNGAQIATSRTTSYSDSTVKAATTYSYFVTAYDAAALASSPSNTITVTTPAAPPPMFTPTGTPAAPVSLFRDGFERGNLSKWSSRIGLFVQSTHSSMGFVARAVGNGGGTAFARKRLVTAQDDLYYRILFRVARQGREVVNLMQFRTNTGAAVLTVGLNSSGILEYRNNRSGIHIDSTTLVDRRRWHSLQVHLQVADTASRIEVWYDGALVSSLSHADAFGSKPIGRIQLGEQRAGLIYDIMFDGVVVSRTFFVEPSPETLLTTPEAAGSGSVLRTAPEPNP
jgi:acid phosphatase type 7